jgi:inhibitor of KinA sporulation pathway (predicted exonuclease)
MSKIIIVDLEATCWKGKIPNNQYSEIIEIGINNPQGILISPKVSTVSEFCNELTTITQHMLDTKGISFEEAIEKVKTEYDLENCIWGSYGQYDYNMLKKECERNNIENPFLNNHINVKHKCAEFLAKKNPIKNRRGIGMKKALEILNIELEGTHHRGVDDAKNIAKIYYKIQNTK